MELPEAAHHTPPNRLIQQPEKQHRKAAVQHEEEKEGDEAERSKPTDVIHGSRFSVPRRDPARNAPHPPKLGEARKVFTSYAGATIHL